MSEFWAEDTFATTSDDDWRQLAEKALAGASFDTLVSVNEDGFSYGPLHPRQAPVRSILRPMPAAPWQIVQRVDDPDPARANLQALADLEGGANALSLVFDGAPSAHGFGLPLTPDALEAALSGVMLDLIRIRIEPQAQIQAGIAAFRTALTKRSDVALDRLTVDHGLDPVGCLAATGRFDEGEEAELRRLVVSSHQQLGGYGIGGRSFEADGRVYHDAGASEGQELGAVLATALFYLRALADASGDIAACAGAIGATLAADQKQFLVTAKFRALRLLWSRLLAASGVDPAHHGIRIHGETSFRMISAKDPHTNILRGTIAAFGAATGGADSISILPFTFANGLPEAKARRRARNVQTILQDESGLARVADPAAGSGGIEALTAGLAKAAWDEFRRIEAEGGIVASLSKGLLQGRIAEKRAARLAAIADRRQVVIGATLYPLETESDIAVLMRRPETRAAGDQAVAWALAPHRLTADREQAA